MAAPMLPGKEATTILDQASPAFLNLLWGLFYLPASLFPSLVHTSCCSWNRTFQNATDILFFSPILTENGSMTLQHGLRTQTLNLGLVLHFLFQSPSYALEVDGYW